MIQDTIADTFHAKLINRISRLKVGHPLDPATDIGALIHQSHFDKVTSYVQIDQTGGATLVAEGARIGDKGWFIQPTLFTHARPEMRIVQEEVFGPFSPHRPSLTRPRHWPYQTAPPAVWPDTSGPMT